MATTCIAPALWRCQERDHHSGLVLAFARKARCCAPRHHPAPPIASTICLPILPEVQNSREAKTLPNSSLMATSPSARGTKECQSTQTRSPSLSTALISLLRPRRWAFTAVRNLPPGQQRQDAMKEIGRVRNRMYEMLRSAGSSQSVVENDAAKKRST